MAPRIKAKQRNQMRQAKTMKTLHIYLLVILSILTFRPAIGQMAPPINFTTETLQNQVSGHGRMDSDVLGTVYIGGTDSIGGSQVEIFPAMGGTPLIVPVTGSLIDIRRSPRTGYVYALHTTVTPSGVEAQISRFSLTGILSPLNYLTLTLPAFSFAGSLAFNNWGDNFIGTSVGIMRFDGPTSSWVLHHSGVGQNKSMIFQADSSLLVADGPNIFRVVDGAPIPVLHHQFVPSNGFADCISLSRISTNALGAGTIASFRVNSTTSGTSMETVALDLSGTPLPFNVSSPTSGSDDGAVCAGLTQEIYWLAGGELTRFQTIPTANVPGSLLFSRDLVAGTITLDLYASTYTPFILGADLAGSMVHEPFAISPNVYIPLNILAHIGPEHYNTYYPIVDGWGLYSNGLPAPEGATLQNGTKSFTFQLPAAISGWGIAMQAIFYLPALSPNLFAMVSNPIFFYV